MAKQVVHKQYTFKLVKAHDFKTVNVDGIFGGLTVKRNININFYTETPDIPKNMIHEVVSNNRLGKQLPIENTGTSIREMPFGVNIDVQTAKGIVIWLNERIKEAENQIASLTEAIKSENNINI